jgi:hypothetical protein
MTDCCGFSRPAWKTSSVSVVRLKVAAVQGCACVGNTANDMRDVAQGALWE